MTDCPVLNGIYCVFFHLKWLLKSRGQKHQKTATYSSENKYLLLKNIPPPLISPPASWFFCSASGPSAPCCVSMASSSLSRRRGLPLGQHGISCSRYIRNKTAMGTGSWGWTNNNQLEIGIKEQQQRPLYRLTLMSAIIQNAYCTLESSWDVWLWFMLCPTIGLFLSMFRKWCMVSLAFAVWFPQPVSERKGSAINGLTKAPKPMKKWRACKNAEKQEPETQLPLLQHKNSSRQFHLFWRTFPLCWYAGIKGQFKQANWSLMEIYECQFCFKSADMIKDASPVRKRQSLSDRWSPVGY